MTTNNSSNTLVYIVTAIIIIGAGIGVYSFVTQPDPANEVSFTDEPVRVTTPKSTTPKSAAPKATTPSPTTTVPKAPAKQGTGTPTPNFQADRTIRYSSTGFSPSTASVVSGQVVTFVNDSSSGFWITSGVTGNVVDYPELDQGKTLGKGGIYTFVFLKPGTWKFTNKLNSNHTGTITVTAK